jgi:hypothetical protein
MKKTKDKNQSKNKRAKERELLEVPQAVTVQMKTRLTRALSTSEREEQEPKTMSSAKEKDIQKNIV